MQLITVDIQRKVFPSVAGFGKAEMFAGRGKDAAELLGVDSQRITAWLRLEDVSSIHLVQLLDKAESLRAKLPRTKHLDGF